MVNKKDIATLALSVTAPWSITPALCKAVPAISLLHGTAYCVEKVHNKDGGILVLVLDDVLFKESQDVTTWYVTSDSQFTESLNYG